MVEYTFIYMADNSFVMPTVVSICSLIQHKSKQAVYKIYVCLDNVSDEQKKVFDAVSGDGFELLLLDVDCSSFNQTAQNGKWDKICVSRTDMFKFELPHVFKCVDSALYIDGDTLINKCVEPLFDFDIEDSYIAAVDDMGDIHDANGYSNSFKRIGIRDMHYFNAGIMYLNLKKMREDNVSEKIWDYRINGTNYFMSQDALNYVLRGNRRMLPFRYNFLTVVFDYYSLEYINNTFSETNYTSIEECISDQVILHMAGELKPWKYNMPWLTEVFLKYYKLSPYRDKELVLASPINRITENNRDKEIRSLWKTIELNISKNGRVVLYGAGDIGRTIYNINKDKTYLDIVLWIDKNAEELVEINGTRIDLPGEIVAHKGEYDRIIIANARPDIVYEIKEELSKIGVDISKCLAIG